MISKLIKHVPKTGGKKNFVLMRQKVNGDAIFYVKLTKPSHFANLYLEGYR